MELNDCINFLLTAAQKKVHQHFSEKISIYDVTPIQYGVLKCLWTSDFQTPSQIAQTLSLDSSSITGLLDRMENKGLVKRVPNSDDRRTLYIVLTPRGKSLEKPLSQSITEAHCEVMSCLEQDEQEAFLSVLGKLADSVRAQA